MLALINVGLIVKEHYRTLQQDAKILFIIFPFFFIPIVLSGFFIFYNKLLTYESTSALLTAFAILTGLLFNVIFILFGIVSSNAERGVEHKKHLLLKHLYANSMYALLVSTIILIILIGVAIGGIWIRDGQESGRIAVILSAIVYFGIFHFISTLLMVFKRLYVLLFPRAS